MMTIRTLGPAMAVAGLLGGTPVAGAVTVTDVGTHPVPPPTTNAATWTMSSACVDITEAGQAACLSVATGSVYRCGWRGSQRCSVKDKVIAKWDGTTLVRMTPGTTATGAYRHNLVNEQPNVINAAGVVGGVRWANPVALLWTAPNTDPTAVGTGGQVTGLNAAGDYVIEYGEYPGGIASYTGKVFHPDGTGFPIRACSTCRK